MEGFIHTHILFLAPFLTGQLRVLAWIAMAVLALIVLWSMFGRRWRRPGITRQCPRCRHAFSPQAVFDGTNPVRCTECGTGTIDERDTHTLRGRVLVGGLAAGAIACWLVLLAFWMGAHVVIARLLLPRWDTTEIALGSGGVVRFEADPVATWLGWHGNEDAWPTWFDGFTTTDGSPDRWDREAMRLGVYALPGMVRVEAENPPSPPYVLGATPQDGTVGSGARIGEVPPVGIPGFGGDLTGDGHPIVLVGEFNPTNWAVPFWTMIAAGKQPGERPRLVRLGSGDFRPDPDGHGWYFELAFRPLFVRAEPDYGPTPPLYPMQVRVPMSWDRARCEWAPDLARLRRDVDRALLGRLVAAAVDAWADCDAARREPAPQEGRTVEDAPTACDGTEANFTAGVVEFLCAGHGDEWQSWVQAHWPGDADSCGQFITRILSDLDDGPSGFCTALQRPEAWEPVASAGR